MLEAFWAERFKLQLNFVFSAWLENKNIASRMHCKLSLQELFINSKKKKKN